MIVRRSRSFSGGRCGFTVVELMVAVSVLTLIVLALFAMFDQTQKALRGNAAQVDVLEGGRTAMELLSREIEQMAAPTGDTNRNLLILLASGPFYQRLAGTNMWRTNVLSDLYFLTRSNRTWTATGYRVLTTKFTEGSGSSRPANSSTVVAPDGCGYLARLSISSNWALPTWTTNRDKMFVNLELADTNSLSRYQRVTDGVVHFRLRLLDSQGQPVPTAGQLYNGVVCNALEDWTPFGPPFVAFHGEALPAAVEIEIGILEPQAVDRLASFGGHVARTNYLAKQAAQVQLFRQRIPIRNASTLLPLRP